MLILCFFIFCYFLKRNDKSVCKTFIIFCLFLFMEQKKPVKLQKRVMLAMMAMVGTYV